MKGYIRLAIIGILIFFSSCKNEIEKKVSKMEDLLEDLEEKYDELRDNSQNYAEYEEDKWFFGDDDLIELDLIRYNNAKLCDGKIKELQDEIDKIKNAKYFSSYDDFSQDELAMSKLILYYNYTRKNFDITEILKKLEIAINRIKSEIAFAKSDDIINYNTDELNKRLDEVLNQYEPSKFLYQDVNYKPNDYELRNIWEKFITK